MMKVELLVVALLAAPSLQAKIRVPPPSAETLLLRALAPAATAYSAVERVQVFGATPKPKALRVRIVAMPGGRVRRDVLGAGKKPPVFSVSCDGRHTLILGRRGNKAWRGPVFEEDPRASLARVRSLYEVSVSTGGRVAKRATWRVDLRARDGRLRRSLWLDRETGLRLKRETYRPEGGLARRERFTQFKLGADAEPSVFETGVSSGTQILPLNAPPFRPRWAPEGFFLVGAEAAAMTFSDGIDVYSIEKTADGRLSVKGSLSEDDAARVLDSLEVAH